MPGGSPSVIYGDVPIPPRSFPDYSAHALAIGGTKNVKPQTFQFGNRADFKAMVVWYRRVLPHYGWRIEQERHNYPTPGSNAIIATRSGEALSVVVNYARIGSRVALIKLLSTK